MPTYFVRSSGGSDANDGLSFAAAFATVQEETCPKITMVADGIIEAWYVTSDAAGTVELDVLVNGVSAVGAGNAPDLVADDANGSEALAGWTTTSVLKGDVVQVYCPAGVAVIKELVVTLRIRRA